MLSFLLSVFILDKSAMLLKICSQVQCYFCLQIKFISRINFYEIESMKNIHWFEKWVLFCKYHTYTWRKNFKMKVRYIWSKYSYCFNPLTPAGVKFAWFPRVQKCAFLAFYAKFESVPLKIFFRKISNLCKNQFLSTGATPEFLKSVNQL